MSIRLLLQYYFWKFRKRKSLGFVIVSLALLVSLLGNALCFYYFDRVNHPGLTFFDCIWYSCISISTIGYGDLSSVSTGARMGTLVFIVVLGLVAFTSFFGIVLDWFIGLHDKEQKGMCRVYDKGHVLIVNFPSAQRVKMVIEELLNGGYGRKVKHIVIVTDSIPELPFSYPDVSFVQGSPIEEETYERANIKDAEAAIVLCTSADDPNSDSVTASIISIIEHMKSDLYTVAECLDVKHKRLFQSSNCDSIVFSTNIANNLLVHESQDRGVVRLVDVITTHKVGDTIFTLEVEDAEEIPITAIDLAKALLDHSVNLLCINRGGKTYTDFSGLQLEAGDRMVYICKQRLDWKKVKGIIREAASRRA